MSGSYNHDQPTRLLNSETTPNGIQQARSTMSPQNVCVRGEVRKGIQLPGLVIFVHGVNSEGEWYKTAEQYLCEGLNRRLGLKDTEFALTPITYNEDSTFPVRIITKGRSPVIRFYWGYSAKPGNEKDFVIPLRTALGDSYTDLTDEQIKNSDDRFFRGGGLFRTAVLHCIRCGANTASVNGSKKSLSHLVRSLSMKKQTAFWQMHHRVNITRMRPSDWLI